MDKKDLRKHIAEQKKQYSQEQLNIWSGQIQEHLESMEIFRSSKTILLYHSLPDEVKTHHILSTWYKEKKCLLPQIQGENLIIRVYEGEKSMQQGALGIWEPTGKIYTELEKIDLVIVPGVAFDKKRNRMGRGKGFYDRFLTKISAPTIGVCFDFQLTDDIPIDSYDVPMNYVISSSGIWQ